MFIATKLLPTFLENIDQPSETAALILSEITSDSIEYIVNHEQCV
ncbi:hypothetical protein VCHA39O220_30409 [Vibrio chagasii]|nr:hypothetical protein VCHA53O466_130034 [Vibrio chagasii]CAH7005943.1 hypothetical protein VCHA39P226_180034 [Vibrio chagasii]CAH7035928.1 hypothetical protein VCHA52P453_190034 [Vibrio chagasii]CAH7226651.1 hypothetical protein VCHA39O220_30409 [Vibrio chagasii]CAH7281870.1 hypothetical protein VCHA41O245_10032 [Vibrio chagasii]